MKTIFKFIYKVFLYPFIEWGKYYEELVDDVYEKDIPNILTRMGYSQELIKKIDEDNK